MDRQQGKVKATGDRAPGPMTGSRGRGGKQRPQQQEENEALRGGKPAPSAVPGGWRTMPCVLDANDDNDIDDAVDKWEDEDEEEEEEKEKEKEKGESPAPNEEDQHAAFMAAQFSVGEIVESFSSLVPPNKQARETRPGASLALPNERALLERTESKEEKKRRKWEAKQALKQVEQEAADAEVAAAAVRAHG